MGQNLEMYSQSVESGKEIPSPHIYTFFVQRDLAIIRRNENAGLLHGCKIARSAHVVLYLLFTDDCYFFFRATEAESRVMKNIIQRYENMFGQAINFSKSSVIFSPNIDGVNRG